MTQEQILYFPNYKEHRPVNTVLVEHQVHLIFLRREGGQQEMVILVISRQGRKDIQPLFYLQAKHRAGGRTASSLVYQHSPEFSYFVFKLKTKQNSGPTLESVEWCSQAGLASRIILNHGSTAVQRHVLPNL